MSPSMIHSTQLDENWQPIYPQDVQIGGIIWTPCQPPGYYVKFRRVPTDEPNTTKYEHADPDRIILEQPPRTSCDTRH